jgi:hypothetical protein
LEELENFDVILPAGGVLDDHFARVALTPYKALIKAQDNVVGLKSIEACQNTNRVGKMVLIGAKDVQDTFRTFVTSAISDTGDLTRNVSMGMRELKALNSDASHVLILTMDLPYVDEKALLRYIDMCPADADIVVPLVTKEEYLDRFPGSKSTFAKLSDGEFTIGCAYFVRPDVFVKLIPQIEKVVANRKNVLKLAQLLGFPFLLKVITKSISSTEVKAKCEELIGCKIAVVRGGPAELAFDIDELDDYEYALRNV